MVTSSTEKHLAQLLEHLAHDLNKAVAGNKAAAQRVRTGTIRLEKVAKIFRKESIAREKGAKGGKRTTAKKAAAPARKTTTTKAKPKAKPKAKATTTRAKTKATTHAGGRHKAVKTRVKAAAKKITRGAKGAIRELRARPTARHKPARKATAKLPARRARM